MIQTRQRKRCAPSQNLVDGSSQSRSQLRNMDHYRNTNNFGNNGVSSVNSNIHPNNLQGKHSIRDTSSSESDFEDIYNTRLSRMIHFSDYETGESSDRTSRPTSSSTTKRNQQKTDPTSIQQVLDSESSSDDSMLSQWPVKKIKRPLSPTSSSDTSDSGIPIANRRAVKRFRIFSSSEGSSSGSLSDANDQNIRPNGRSKSKENTNHTITDHPSVSQLDRNSTQENGENLVIIPGLSVENLRGRRIPVIETESESESALTTSHTVRGRRIPVIESEDDINLPEEHAGRGISRTSTAQGVAQRASSVLGIRRNRRRRNRRRRTRRTRARQENENNLTTNVADPVSNTHVVRRRQIVGANITNSEEVRQNSLRVTALAEETRGNGDLISSRRRVRGRRIPVVSSEDDSESNTLNRPNNEISNPDGGNEVVASFRSDVNTERSRVPRNYERNTAPSYDLRRWNIPLRQSEHESSSDESDIRPRTLSNRITPLFQSDDSLSTSSSSSASSDYSIPIGNPRRRNRPVPVIEDYDYVPNDYEFNVNDCKISSAIKVPSKSELQNGNSSDTDGEAEKCPICLVGFKLQEIGKPKSCDHNFCSVCIKEWATKNNTCPVDRKPFDGIIVYDKIDGKVICEVPVEKPNPEIGFEIESFGRIEEIVADLFDSSDDSPWILNYSDGDGPVADLFDSSDFNYSDGDGPDEVCSVCRRDNEPHRMIACDSCNIVYHLGCVNPPLRNFPSGQWYCPHCEYETDTFSDSD